LSFGITFLSLTARNKKTSLIEQKLIQKVSYLDVQIKNLEYQGYRQLPCIGEEVLWVKERVKRKSGRPVFCKNEAKV